MKKVFKTMAFTLLGLVLSMNLMAETVTYQHVFSEKPSTGNNIDLSGVNWNITATNLGSYNSGNYAGVQIGTKNADGSITLTSPSAWSYQKDAVTYTKIKEVRVWCNLGGTSCTPSVTIGGTAASSNGTVTKNSSAGTDWTKASKVTFTPAANSNTGVVVVSVSSVKAGYICCLEIDCEEASTPTGPSLSVSPTTIDFGTVDQKAAIPAGQDVEVTFANLTTNDVTASISGDFNISKSGSFTSGNKITVTPKSTATIGTIEGTLTVKATTDDITKTVPITMIVAAPEVGVSFEKATSAYTDWEFTNFASQQTHSDVKAHTGAYFGTTDSKASGSMVTKAKIAKPGTLQFFISKQSTNTSSSSWKVSVSSDKSEWTQVGEAIDATSMTKGTWTEVNVDLTAYSNVYVKLEYAGSTAVRCIDDVVFIAPQSYDVTLSTNPASVGTVTAKVNNVEIGAQVEEGQTVTLTATPNDAHAYRFKEWQSDDVTITDNAFEMPGKAVAITAVFEPVYAVSVTTAGEGSGTATINGSTETIYVGENDEITLVAENATGSEFGGWTATDNIVIDKEGDAETFAYAGSAGTITATFNKKQCTILDTPVLDDPSNVTYSGATLNWGAVDNVGAYILNVKQGEISIVTDEMVIGSTSFAVSELSANTTYSYSVYAMAGDDAYCDGEAAEGNFTTADYPAATLTLSENGVERAWGTGLKLNSKINLPTDAATEITGKVLVGYVAENFEDTKSAEPDNMFPLGAEYTMTATEAKLFAVYATKSEGDAYYQKITAAETDWSGKYLIVSTDGAMDGSLNGGTGGVGKAQTHKTVTENDKVGENIKASFGDQYYMIIEKTGNNYYLKSQYTGEGATPYIYRTSNSNGMDASATASTAIGISWDDGIKIAGATSGDGASTLLKYNKTSGSTGEMFRFYKDGGTSQQAITLYKRVANIDYSAYVTKGTKALGKPSFDPEGGEYNTPQTITLSATEGDIYYTINDGEEKLYEEEIKLENRGQYVISAYAKKGDAQSEPNEQTYTLDWAYTLAELVAEGAPTSTGRTVTVILDNEVITKFATSGSYINGFYTMVGTQEVEVYCYNSPATWEVGGKVSGTVTCPWKLFGGTTWELCPTDWEWASYTAPAKITSLVITNDVTNKNYTAGQKLDFTGLTVTGVYSDATEEDVTADVDWTEVTLTQGQVSATATATLNNVETGNKDVSKSIEITGLTVGAAKTLESIYVDASSTHKTAFFVGRPFSAEGLKVMAKYNIGEDQPIAVANLTITNTTFSEAKAEHTINISYTENGVTKETSYNVEVKYMNLSELVAEDVPTNTSVKVAFSDVEITGFYKNSNDKRAGVYVNVIGKNGSNIELYSSGTPSATLNDWQEGGKLASKGDYITGTWKYYDGGSVWEIDFGSAYAWSTNIEYTAPEIYPTDIDLDQTEAIVKQSKSITLTANLTPANATVLNNLAWESNNPQVTVVPSTDKKSATVTVAPDATVGTATITVKVDDKDGNELSATCVITIQEYVVPHYGLYSGAIEEGDYIFKADGEYYYMNNTNNNGRLANVANENNPEIVNNVITTDAETYVWHIAQSGDYWTIQNLENSKYVSSTAKSSAGLVDDATANTALWTITYDATNEVYTFVNLGRSQAASDADKCYLRNNNNSGWACYSSTQSNAITLYKAGFTPAAALTSIEIKGELSQAEYFQGKSVKYDGLTVEGTYSDGDKKTITEGIVWSADPTTFTEIGDNISVTITATVQTKNGEITDDANFTVKVVESQQVSYGLVTSANTLYDGASIILGAVFGTATDPIYAVNQGFDTKYLAAYRSNTEGSDLEYADEVMKTAFASEITLKKVEGGWKLMDENNKYIISNNADIALADNADEATVWTITIEEDVAKIASGSNIIYYNTSSPRFKTYTSAQQEIGIYMKNLLPVRTGLTAGKIGTICYPQAIAAVDGANLYQPNYKDDAVKNIYFSTPDEYKAGLPMIFQADREIMKVLFTGEEAPLIEDMEVTRGMVGNLGVEDIIVPDGMYIFTQNKLWLVGVNCKVATNHAYVNLNLVPFSVGQLSHNLPSGAPRRTISLGNGSAGAPTGVNNLREGDAVNKTQKFFYNGNIYMNVDGRTFDVTGKMIK